MSMLVLQARARGQGEETGQEAEIESHENPRGASGVTNRRLNYRAVWGGGVGVHPEVVKLGPNPDLAWASHRMVFEVRNGTRTQGLPFT